MDDDFSSKRRKVSKGAETKVDSEERDDELRAEIEALQQMFKKDRKEES